MSDSRLAQTVFWSYVLVLSALLLAPGPVVEQAAGINDKLAHVAAFGLFAIFAAGLCTTRRGYLAACAGIAVYGGLMEVAQSAIPGRDVSWLDALADIVGIVIAATLLQYRFRRRDDSGR